MRYKNTQDFFSPQKIHSHLAIFFFLFIFLFLFLRYFSGKLRQYIHLRGRGHAIDLYLLITNYAGLFSIQIVASTNCILKFPFPTFSLILHFYLFFFVLNNSNIINNVLQYCDDGFILSNYIISKKFQYSYVMI